ncbi:tetratricopeptide repeat protein [Nostoc sp. 2RC]|nr:tetratricopeptide repeat protein [Nostoc sp. 2RC]
MGVVLLSDAVGANVSGLQNYSPEISPEILLDKYRDKFPSLETRDKQVLLRSYHNQQKVYLAQQPASTPSIPLNTEQRKLYEQGVKLVKEGQDLEKKGTREFYKQAINKYQQGLKIAQELKLRQEEVEILFLTGSVYYSISDKKNALDYLNKALEISRELNKPVFEATILGGIGAIYTNTDEPREALSYLQQAQSIFIAHQKFHELVITYKAIATVHNKLGNTKEALDSLNKALKIYRETLKDSSGQADTLYSIGSVYSIAGETQTAINQPLARKYGRLGWKSVPSSTLIKQKQGKLFFVGYSGDYPDPTKEGYESYTAGKGWTADYQDNCSIVSEQSNLLLHDCATAGGASGGPIIDWIDNWPYVVALNNGEVKNRRTGQDIINFAVKMDFLDKLVARK